MLVPWKKSRESVVIGGPDADGPVDRSEVSERIQAGGQRKRPKSGPAAANEEINRWEDEGGGPAGTTPSETLSSEMP